MASKKYGAAHRAERERWQTTIDNGEAQCAEPICLQARDGHGRRINPGEHAVPHEAQVGGDRVSAPCV